MEITKTRKGYEIETSGLDIDIADGKISTNRPSGIRELDGKRFASSDEALEYVKAWLDKQIAFAAKSTVIGF